MSEEAYSRSPRRTRVTMTITAYIVGHGGAGGYYDMASQAHGGYGFSIPNGCVDTDSITPLGPEELTPQDWSEISGHVLDRVGEQRGGEILALFHRIVETGHLPLPAERDEDGHPIAPGRWLAMRLEQLGMSHTTAAQMGGMTAARIGRIVRDDELIDERSAAMLAPVTGIPEAAWQRVVAAHLSYYDDVQRREDDGHQ